MSAGKTIIISAPKFIASEPTIALSPGNSLFNASIRKTGQIKKTFQCISTMEKIVCPPLPTAMLAVETTRAPSRKRRLDHLSLDEKIQRKKLKNRIAAQSSRDRKKAKMDDLEAELRELKKHNKSLTTRCLRLEEESQRLSEENQKLREQLSQTRVGCEPSAATGPAESWALNPPQQGRGTQPAPGLTLLTLLLIALSHRYPTSSMTSTAMTSLHSLKSLPIAYSKKLLQTWLLRERQRNLEQFPKKNAILKWWGRHQKNWNPVEIH